MSCCHVARSSATDWALRRPPPASHSPRRSQIPSGSSVPPPRLSAMGRWRRSIHGGRPRHRPRTAGGCRQRRAGAHVRRWAPSTRRRTPGAPGVVSTADGSPVSGRASTDPGVPEHAGVGIGFLAQEQHRPGRRGSPPHGGHPWVDAPAPVASHRRHHRHHRRRAPPPKPPGHAGPTRNRVPCRSGGNEPYIGRVGARPDSITRPPPITLITMRPINLPAYGKVEACRRSRRTSPSAA